MIYFNFAQLILDGVDCSASSPGTGKPLIEENTTN
jgi:hypothetical protein